MADPVPDPTPAPKPEPPTDEQVLADERLRPLLAAYAASSHDFFLRCYAGVLRDLHYNGETYEANLEYLLHQHDTEAYRFLWMIQHQKLFDMECQWRAEQLAVPGAQLAANFNDWHSAIERCPVLPPISPAELDLLDAYLDQLTDPGELETGNLSSDFWLRRLYPSLHDDDDPGGGLVPWTEFWDQHRGTNYLRQLPDLRGAKEQRYRRAAHQKRPAAAPPPSPPPVPDPRPALPGWGHEFDQQVSELLRRCEPAARLRQFQSKLQQQYDAYDNADELALALERLRNAGSVVVPIGAHPDWRVAVIEAGNRHYIEQLRQALPRVYADYRQRLELGIGLVPAASRRTRGLRSEFKADAKLIRKGRRALGEPDDLDF